MMHSIDLGHERQSGRTTIMLATLVGLGEVGTLYVAFNQSQAVRAQTRSKHRVRCIGAEAFVWELPLWLSSVEYLALDGICFWPPHMLNEAVRGAKRDGRLKLLMVAH